MLVMQCFDISSSSIFPLPFFDISGLPPPPLGIIDPLRPDVKEAVRVAQKAGIVVRMVTGDNISTACAIAKQCGILKEGGVALEGAAFRALTPAELDRLLPQLQVLARASPDDKYLLVTRLNGHGIPSSQEEWEERMKGKEGVTFEKHRDLLLPGFRDEWIAARPGGGEVVGVTGDGTNDAPALKVCVLILPPPPFPPLSLLS